MVKRKTQGVANGTIDIGLMTLGRALRLAMEQGKRDRVPVIRTSRSANPRSGFFEADQFEAVSRALPDDLALAAKIGYTYGWRVANEVLTLTKGQLTFTRGRCV